MVFECNELVDELRAKLGGTKSQGLVNAVIAEVDFGRKELYRFRDLAGPTRLLWSIISLKQL